jgi:carboxymethylenebutenolidase
MVEFAVDGGQAAAHLALPAGSSLGPGLIVLHPWWGLNACIKSFADRLASAGFVVLAPDLYHGAIASTIEDATRLREALDPARAMHEVDGATAYLREHDRAERGAIGVIGFSLGAAFAMALAESRPDDIAATVLFYGLNGRDPSRTRSAYLGHFAEDDPYEPAEGARLLERSLRARKLEATFHVYPGTGHWFFEADRTDAFNPGAAQLAWERTLAFLTRHLASSGRSPA